MGRPRKSRSQRRLRASSVLQAQGGFSSAPHSFVFHRGLVGKNIRNLVLDLRKIMEPYTARALKVRKKNSLKDFLAVAGPLGVSHFLVLSKSTSNIHLKLFCLPAGPTLTFRVTQYSLLRDVVSSLKRHRMHEQQFSHPPLLILSNFGLQQIQVKLMASTFQNLFPSINVHRVNLNTIRRCLLITYDPDTQLLELRHYSVKVVPVGVSKGLKKLLQEKFPNMSHLEDISELLVRDINLSESEAEQDGSHNVLELPQPCAGRGNIRAQQSAVRLTEIGPRMTLQLLKVEEGLAQGNVLYHSLVHKTESEVREILARKEAKLQLRAERRRKQEEDVERKRRKRQEQRARSLAGMSKRSQSSQLDGDSGAEDPGEPQSKEEEEEESDEAEYYRQEVGQEPDPDLFPDRSKRKLPPSLSAPSRKRRRRPQEPPNPLGTPPRGPPTQHPPPQGPPRAGARRSLKRTPKLLPKGKRIFRRPGRGKKGKS